MSDYSNPLVETQILIELEKRSRTTKDLAKILGANYYTVRKSILALQEQGVITHATYTLRNTAYKLTEAAYENRSMPMITNKGKKFPIVNLLGWVGQESNSKATKATLNITRYVTRILNLALDEPLGRKRVPVAPEDELRRLKSEMKTDREALLAMIKLYDDILNNDLIWNYEYLKKINDSPTFKPDDVMEAYTYFYPTATDRTTI